MSAEAVQSFQRATPAGETAVLDARGIVKTFGGVHALKGVDFQVGPGEIRALAGENGAGKSTLIKIVTGAYRPDQGEIRYRGDQVSFSRPADAQRVGISTIYQEVNLIPLLSVAHNIFLGREPRKFGFIDVKAMNQKAREIIAGFGIDVDVTMELGRLGLGTQQMVALARALSVEAKVVIMDEPTSSLETREVETLFKVARSLREQGVGIVYVSHRLDELWELCDSVTILRDGSEVHTGPIAELSRRDLVAKMLGREIVDVEARSTTASETEASQVKGEPILEVEDLQVRHCLHGVDLSVRPGEIVGLAGLLGSGRTETVSAIYGAMHREDGAVSVGKEAVRPNSVRRALKAKIALLTEDRKAEGLIPDLSIRDNLALAVMPSVSKFGIINDRAIDTLVDTFIKRLNIKAASPNQLISELSGGNQQKVLLARWLCTEPKVFLLDEPTRGIDVGAKQEVRKVIDELAEQGLAVVMISFETEEIVQSADRIVVLHEGKVSDELSGTDITNSRLLLALVGEERTKENSDTEEVSS